MSVLAHVDVAPIVPAQLAVLLAVAAVAGAGWWRPPGPSPARTGTPRSLPGLALVGAVCLAAVLFLVVVGEPRRVLAGAWLGLVLVSVGLGGWWRRANPVRSVAGGLARVLGDPQEEGARPLPDVGWWPAAVTLAVLLWASAAPLAGSVVLGVVVVHLVAQLAAAMVYGRGWLDTGDGVEALSVAVGQRLAVPLVLAVPVGIALQSQLVTTGTWRELTAGLAHPWWLLAEAGLAGVLVVAAYALGVGVWQVAAGYVVAWAVTVLAPLPTVVLADPTAVQAAEALATAFVPPLVVLAGHVWAARHAGRVSIPLTISAVAGTLLFGPW